MNTVFFKEGLKDYGGVGAWVPSSRYIVQRILKVLEPTDRFIIEYGAGDGVITKALLRHLPADGKVIAVEINKDLVGEMERINDPRLRVLHDDARYVSRDLFGLGLPRIDAVICGVPLSTRALLDRDIRAMQEEIIANSSAAMAPGGRFIFYQHTPVALPVLKRFFSDVKWQFEPRNFLPYLVMVARK
ncbi:MAG: type 12 methyltransferase [Parcubacteria group bacterium Gr01-1014_33]|nr:MAG: type 12 methyltransferase [Parcubacteria group bacterium Gr01-1014_33]